MTDRRKIHALMKFWIALCAIAIVLGYGAFRSKDFIEGPELSLLSPLNGALVSDALIEIRGNAQNISFLTLNDDKIFTDEAGDFTERVLLSYGYNVMTLKAKDRFGRETVEKLELIYK
jgi:hypothetical protein